MEELHRNVLNPQHGVLVLHRFLEFHQTQFNDFPHALHQNLLAFGLGVASVEFGHAADEVAVVPLFDNYGEFPVFDAHGLCHTLVNRVRI